MMKRTLHISGLLLLALLTTSCSRYARDVGFSGFAVGVLAYGAVVFAALKLAAARNVWVDTHGADVNRIAARYWGWAEKTGAWFSRRLSGKAEAGALLLICFAVALVSIVFLFVGLYAEGARGLCYAGAVLAAIAAILYQLTFFERTKKELKKAKSDGGGLVEELSVGSCVAFVLFDLLSIGVVIVGIFIVLAIAIGSSPPSSYDSSDSASRGSSYGSSSGGDWDSHGYSSSSSYSSSGRGSYGYSHGGSDASPANGQGATKAGKTEYAITPQTRQCATCRHWIGNSYPVGIHVKYTLDPGRCVRGGIFRFTKYPNEGGCSYWERRF